MNSWEADMLRVLSGDLRIVSLEQAARIWWPDQKRALRNAREAVQKLEFVGWLKVHRALSRPVAELSAPVFVWEPGQPTPPFRELSQQLRRRALADARVVTILAAGPRTRKFHGQSSRGRCIKLTQVTHDLHVAEVWRHHREQGFARHRWIGEDGLSSDWPARQIPDAVLLSEQGHYLKAIEYGGGYPVTRLRNLHRGLSAINLGYELW